MVVASSFFRDKVNNAGVVGLEYLQDHIDGTPTTSDKVNTNKSEIVARF
jgi:hypothetical protein